MSYSGASTNGCGWMWPWFVL